MTEIVKFTFFWVIILNGRCVFCDGNSETSIGKSWFWQHRAGP